VIKQKPIGLYGYHSQNCPHTIVTTVTKNWFDNKGELDSEV